VVGLGKTHFLVQQSVLAAVVVRVALVRSARLLSEEQVALVLQTPTRGLP
jgi:hypothetical protein